MESASLFKRIKGFSFSSDQNKLAQLAERNEKIESWDLSLVEYPTQKRERAACKRNQMRFLLSIQGLVIELWAHGDD
jgi:hypothetical protein